MTDPDVGIIYSLSLLRQFFELVFAVSQHLHPHVSTSHVHDVRFYSFLTSVVTSAHRSHSRCPLITLLSAVPDHKRPLEGLTGTAHQPARPMASGRPWNLNQPTS